MSPARKSDTFDFSKTATIAEGHLIRYSFMDSWGTIRPAPMLFFDNEKPMPIREYRWQEYLPLLSENKK